MNGSTSLESEMQSSKRVNEANCMLRSFVERSVTRGSIHEVVATLGL